MRRGRSGPIVVFREAMSVSRADPHPPSTPSWSHSCDSELPPTPTGKGHPGTRSTPVSRKMRGTHAACSWLFSHPGRMVRPAGYFTQEGQLRCPPASSTPSALLAHRPSPLTGETRQSCEALGAKPNRTKASEPALQPQPRGQRPLSVAALV